MNIIFLDIDGVLNNELFYIERAEKAGIPRNKKRAGDSRHSNICQRCVKFLNIMLEENDAYIVLSSSWRSDGDLDYWKQFMEEVGVFEARKRMIGMTGYGFDRNRGMQILQWIKDNEEVIGCRSHNFHTYVILDDDSDMLYWQRENFYLVDPYVGLTPRVAFKVKQIFDKFKNIKEDGKG